MCTHLFKLVELRTRPAAAVALPASVVPASLQVIPKKNISVAGLAPGGGGNNKRNTLRPDCHKRAPLPRVAVPLNSLECIRRTERNETRRDQTRRNETNQRRKNGTETIRERNGGGKAAPAVFTVTPDTFHSLYVDHTRSKQRRKLHHTSE